MRIGIRLHDTAPGTLPQRLSFAKKQGFCCAHLALSKTVDGFRMEDAPSRLKDPAFVRDVRTAFAETGMDCAVLGCYLALAEEEKEARLRIRQIYAAHLRFAVETGALVVGTETPISPASPLAKDAPHSEEALRLFLDCLKPIVYEAEEAGALLAVEPVWSHIVSTPERAERMLEEIGSDHLRIILDASNLIAPDTADMADRIIEDAISRLGDRVAVLHMKDFRLLEGKKEELACGLGQMRYEQLLRFARDRDLPMTLENTVPDNAEAARLFLEGIAASL